MRSSVYKSRDGSVLIVVLLVCLSLVSVTLMFGHTMLMAYRSSDNDLAGRQADQAIEGAARYAQYVISTTDAKGQMPDLTTYQSENLPVGDACFWFIGRSADLAPVAEPVFGLIDEASKLNINTATLPMLEALPGMTAELAAAIVDWRDADDEVTDGGAESTTYMMKTPAYACKNALFESTEELALVSGADWAILYGEDANLNGVIDPNEDDGEKTSPSDDSDGTLTAGILEYVTAFSREPNTRLDGTPRFNVTRDSPEFTTFLRDTLGDSRATEIAQRTANPRPRSVLEFLARADVTDAEADQLADALTAADGDFIVGLINANTATEAVLACVPGIGVEHASELIAARAKRSTPATNLAWVADVLTPQAIAQAGPYLTAQSWQFSADIAAVGRHGRGYRRTHFVIDNTGDSPQIVYRQNLAPLGWALGATVRQTLMAREETTR